MSEPNAARSSHARTHTYSRQNRLKIRVHTHTHTDTYTHLFYPQAVLKPRVLQFLACPSGKKAGTVSALVHPLCALTRLRTFENVCQT